MATTDEQDTGTPKIHRGAVHRYPVKQPDGGRPRHQLVLIVTDPDETGAVRGWPLGYEEHAGHFRPEDFVHGDEPTPAT